jgi:hypothetical protein
LRAYVLSCMSKTSSMQYIALHIAWSVITFPPPHAPSTACPAWAHTKKKSAELPFLLLGSCGCLSICQMPVFFAGPHPAIDACGYVCARFCAAPRACCVWLCALRSTHCTPHSHEITSISYLLSSITITIASPLLRFYVYHGTDKTEMTEAVD